MSVLQDESDQNIPFPFNINDKELSLLEYFSFRKVKIQYIQNQEIVKMSSPIGSVCGLTYYNNGIIIRGLDEILWLDTNCSQVEIRVAENEDAKQKHDLVINHQDHILRITFYCSEDLLTFQEKLDQQSSIKFPPLKQMLNLKKQLYAGKLSQVDLYSTRSKYYRGIQNLMQFYAVKTYDISSQKVNKIVMREIKYLRCLKSKPFISKLIKIFNSENQCNLVFQYFKEGSLLEYLNKKGSLKEFQIKIIMHQILEGLGHIHEKQIIHRDLKPENIIMEDSKLLKINIIDFGLACKTGSINRLDERCGTPGYIAPEILNAG
ncbi:phosphorylase b kinase gamma catalytic liver testis isoform [Stylonychia lemnae]|uniref:Phosphorylase b kinase gamma catalytic liver testis isoform n=1 Tax=Stylonychia lemnae TaxID=5949 RepID=A0A077ZRN9_STYLE|nr:phosphorylase b kinase gamma catalytic liver testis isoform [Stylonychia lemnae]|eukprot:CDW72547.1 phosphorylase b kinase gamma catalytic liver testis isoform [Stylonychia lemnae]